MIPDEFRRIAVSMKGAVEGAHMGHPDFRANGRIFATLHTGDQFGMVKLMPEEQEEFLRTSPKMFVPSSGAWGRQGCTNVRLEAADKATVRAAMNLAWQQAISKPPPKKSAKSSSKLKLPGAKTNTSRTGPARGTSSRSRKR
jgi:YjbR protein